MRFKPDGSLDEVWRGPVPRQQILTPDDLERIREELINETLRDHPTLTRAEAAEHIDAFF